MSTTVEDLSQAILAWLDQRPVGLTGSVRSANWGTKKLQDSFRDSLDEALRTAVVASRFAGVIAGLTDAFNSLNSLKSGTVARANKWGLALQEGRKTDTFTVMQEEITQLLEREPDTIASDGLQPADYADLIVTALASSLAYEADRIPKRNVPPEDMLFSAMVPMGVRKMYNVRLFLVFFGMIALTVIIYGILQPNYWLNPASGTIILLGYITLVATAIVHDHTSRGAT